MRDTRLLAENQRIDVSPEQSQGIHAYLADEITSSKHADRFAVRPFPGDLETLGRPHPLDASYSYLPAREDITPEHIQWLTDTAGNLIMLDGDWAALVKAFQQIQSDETIVNHKRLGGNVLYICNHQTYADLPALVSASARAKLLAGIEDPQHSQDIITHRLINLFGNKLIATLYDSLSDFDHEGGYISDDVLLVAGGQIGTLPSSASGYERFVKSIRNGGNLRSDLNGSTVRAYQALRQLGGRDIFMAPAGTEMTVDHEAQRDIEATYTKSTTELIAGEKKDSARDLLVIPIYIHADPFTGNLETLLAPKPTPFVFLEPRQIHKPSDVHQAAWEISIVGRTYKPSGKYEPLYNPPGPNFLYKDEVPRIWISHTPSYSSKSSDDGSGAGAGSELPDETT